MNGLRPNIIVIDDMSEIDVEVIPSEAAKETLKNIQETEETLIFSEAKKQGDQYNIRGVFDSELYKELQTMKAKVFETDIGEIIARVFEKNDMRQE